jgi:hypothetical protein
MQSPSDWLQMAGQLLSKDFLQHCPCLFVLARHAGMSLNIGIGIGKMSVPAKISLIFAKLQQSISLLTGVLSKNVKSKKQPPLLSDISFSTLDLHPEAVMEILSWSRKLHQLV